MATKIMGGLPTCRIMFLTGTPAERLIISLNKALIKYLGYTTLQLEFIEI